MDISYSWILSIILGILLANAARWWDTSSCLGMGLCNRLGVLLIIRAFHSVNATALHKLSLGRKRARCSGEARSPLTWLFFSYNALHCDLIRPFIPKSWAGSSHQRRSRLDWLERMFGSAMTGSVRAWPVQRNLASRARTSTRRVKSSPKPNDDWGSRSISKRSASGTEPHGLD